MIPPKEYADTPVGSAFELWLTANYEDVDAEAADLFWECFLAGFEIGKLETEE